MVQDRRSNEGPLVPRYDDHAGRGNVFRIAMVMPVVLSPHSGVTKVREEENKEDQDTRGLFRAVILKLSDNLLYTKKKLLAFA